MDHASAQKPIQLTLSTSLLMSFSQCTCDFVLQTCLQGSFNRHWLHLRLPKWAGLQGIWVWKHISSKSKWLLKSLQDNYHRLVLIRFQFGYIWHQPHLFLLGCIQYIYKARFLWPTIILYHITKLLHLYLYRSNGTAPLKYLCFYHVVLTQLFCWSTCVGTPRLQWSYFKEAALLLLCRYQWLCSNCVNRVSYCRS